MDVEFGYDFSEGGDFNVVTADYFAIPKLIADGKLDMGITSPLHGTAPYMAGDANEEVGIYWPRNWYANQDFGIPPLNNLNIRTEFLEENPGAGRAAVRAWNKGMSWFVNNADQIAQQDYAVKRLPVKNQQQAEFVIDWFANLEGEVNHPFLVEDILYTQQRKANERRFLEELTSRGLLVDGWQGKLQWATDL